VFDVEALFEADPLCEAKPPHAASENASIAMTSNRPAFLKIEIINLFLSGNNRHKTVI
jgi:hypothetical protein